MAIDREGPVGGVHLDTDEAVVQGAAVDRDRSDVQRRRLPRGPAVPGHARHPGDDSLEGLVLDLDPHPLVAAGAGLGVEVGAGRVHRPPATADAG